MNQFQFAATEPGQRRGACPTLREPMQTGDGLLARLRPVGGVLSPAQLRAMARLAGRFGNGQIEITARGNMQVRGLTADGVALFAEAAETIVAIETGVPVEISPLAGFDPNEIADPRGIAAALKQAIARSGLVFAPKLVVVVDGGGAIGLDALRADVRLRAQQSHWAILVGEHIFGLVETGLAADAVMVALRAIAEMGAFGRGRDIDVELVRERLKPLIVGEPGLSVSTRPVNQVTKLRDGTLAARAGLTFGASNMLALTELADAAEAEKIAEFRLAPDHGLIAVCASESVAAQFQNAAEKLGFVVRASDPRRAISACVGSEGCTSGSLAARRVAEALAQAEPEFFDGSFILHVSGCSKGCAYPSQTLLTLVGDNDGVGLIIEGSARGEPALSLSSDAVPIATQRLAAIWRDNRGLGESVGSCFKRLGAAAIIAAVRQG